MKNLEIAKIFGNIADLLEIKEENPFKVRAYRRASQNLEGIAEDLATIATRGDLQEIPGIGKDLSQKIEEYLITGKLDYYENLKKEIPEGLITLMSVQGVGPKKAKLFFDHFKITTVDKLEEKAKKQLLRTLPGIKAKTEENILRGIALFRQGVARMNLGQAITLAHSMTKRLEALPEVERLDLAGSLRRWKETIGDIDILVISDSPKRIMEAFVKGPEVKEVLGKGPTKSSVLTHEGYQMDVRVLQREHYGAALAYFTGSKAHNVRIRELASKRGLKINEYGVFDENTGKRVGGEKEEDIYHILDLPYILPEVREDLGEIEAALEGRLPQLVEISDIRGDLHVHSRYSDGAHTIAEMVDAAKARGYSYIAITDHSQSLGIAHGLPEEALLQKIAEIRGINKKERGFRVLCGTEVDIRLDGTLDYPDEVLARLDVVVASIHSGFKRSAEEQTRRIIRAVENPHVHIIGHLSGRLIGEREGCGLDIEEVFGAAARTGTALEINAYPKRLDITDIQSRRAKEKGVKVVINTDAHLIDHLDYMDLGVSVARRGWLEKGDVLNTLEVDDFLKAIKKRV